MNKLLDKILFIIAIILIFGSFIFKPRETTTDKKIEINNIDINDNNPSNADKKNLNNLLIIQEEYILSYNCSKGIPNWVGWRTSKSDLGELSRSDDFREDNSLPKKCYQVDEKDYRNSGYDRGHLMPSADRTRSKSANSSSFLMVNMIPQHPDNNRQIWRALEIYSRELVEQGFTLHSFAGGNGQIKTINKGKISVPQYTWKVILIENERSGEIDAIAVIMPNSEKVKKTDWTDYLVTVDKVEEITNYDFFAYLSDSIEEEIESKIYH